MVCWFPRANVVVFVFVLIIETGNGGGGFDSDQATPEEQQSGSKRSRPTSQRGCASDLEGDRGGHAERRCGEGSERSRDRINQGIK